MLVASAACSAGDDRVEPTPPDTTPTTVGEGDTGGATADQDGDSVIDIGEDDVVLTAGLVRFGGCGPLIDYLHTEYLARVESEAFDDEAAWEDAWRQRRTSLHRFDISGDEADYESSGAVLGVIHNQFSLSEHNGHLRVVTTIGDPWGDESESHVRVLSTDGDVLVEVGSVVIGDDLWTLSYPRGNTSGDATGRLEVNDLDTLEHLAGVDL